MNLHELRSTITESIEADWNLVELGRTDHGTIAGTSEFEAEIMLHHAAFIDDLSIAIEWGRSVHIASDDKLSLDDYAWARLLTWQDRRVEEEFVDVFFAGSLVDRVTILVVDGYRSHLPMPRPDGDAWAVSSWHATLARIVDGLSGHTDFSRYLKQARFVVQP